MMSIEQLANTDLVSNNNRLFWQKFAVNKHRDRDDNSTGGFSVRCII